MTPDSAEHTAGYGRAKPVSKTRPSNNPHPHRSTTAAPTFLPQNAPPACLLSGLTLTLKELDSENHPRNGSTFLTLWPQSRTFYITDSFLLSTFPPNIKLLADVLPSAPYTWELMGPSGPHRRGSENAAGRKNGKQGCKHGPPGVCMGRWHSGALKGTADLEGDRGKLGVMGAPGEGTGKLERAGKADTGTALHWTSFLII